MNETGLNQSDFLSLLINSYYGDTVEVLRNYRLAIKSRIKKGISKEMVDELIKLQELTNDTLRNL
jgi:hypothetical protein